MSDSLSEAYTIAAYMRIASIAVGLYDYLETQPTAWRFYKEQWRSRRISLSTVLFILIRFISICALTVSSVGFFYEKFTLTICEKYYLLPPAFKVLQAMVSQAILGIRAYNLSKRSRKVGCFLMAVYVIACILQWITTLYQRSPRLGDRHGNVVKPGGSGNCGAFSEGKQLGAWIYYAIAIIYDSTVTGMSAWFLLKYKFATRNSMMSKVTKMMLYDGLGYLVTLTAVNVLNLILYKTSRDIQNAGASLGYCVSWIMSQRLLIHLHDAQRERRIESLDNAITISQNLDSAREISRAFRNQFEQKSGAAVELTRPDSETDTRPQTSESVLVRIERTIQLDHRPRTYELEDYTRSGRLNRDIHPRR
ncbi:hypothetical protein BDQ12DRAFT_673071 [Crucibulum laeve]|uniref:Uncharacterized protein n=1 Tax=Crucibulum laeve TaxID=68775 RepID=A0A5C3MHU0_9AGAR|nr:hypothetical protein BDQ12DRAFT_673071 [Crucibulum laeve]